MNDSQAEDTDSSPDHINNLRERMMKQLSALLESQTRTRNFATSITTLVKRVHTESLEGIEQVLGRIDDPNTADSLRQSMINCRNLDIALDCLVDERRRQWYKNGKYLKQVIDELNDTTSYLASILVEKGLLEKQSQVLENIIFSHEKVSQWKEFVQEILTSFHAIFPFNFFFIAFAEEHGLSLYFYYLGDYADTAKQEVRQRLSKNMLRQLNLPEDAPLDIEEFHIPGRSKKIVIDDIKMITVPVPNQSYGLAGLLALPLHRSTP